MLGNLRNLSVRIKNPDIASDAVAFVVNGLDLPVVGCIGGKRGCRFPRSCRKPFGDLLVRSAFRPEENSVGNLSAVRISACIPRKSQLCRLVFRTVFRLRIQNSCRKQIQFFGFARPVFHRTAVYIVAGAEVDHPAAHEVLDALFVKRKVNIHHKSEVFVKQPALFVHKELQQILPAVGGNRFRA